MSFKLKKKTKNNAGQVTITSGDHVLEAWQYEDCVMFTEKGRYFCIKRKDAEKLADFILNGERNL